MIVEFSGKYRFLSNFYLARVDFEDVSYRSVEHAYQAAKTILLSERVEIAMLRIPGAAKRRGRTVHLRPNWDNIKVNIMRQLLHEKFKAPDLAQKLISTADVPLIEGNDWGDKFWGQSPVGVGENWLGRLLMDTRRELKLEPR